MAMLNLKIAWDKCPPPTQDPDKAEFKVGNMELIKKQAQTSAFDTNTHPVSESVNEYLTNPLMYKTVQGRSDVCLYSISNYCILLHMFWHTYLTWPYLEGQENTLITLASCLACISLWEHM